MMKKSTWERKQNKNKQYKNCGLCYYYKSYGMGYKYGICLLVKDKEVRAHNFCDKFKNKENKYCRKFHREEI